MVSVRPKFVFFTLLLFLASVLPVRAADSCTATVSPASVQTSTDTNFSFSVTNTGTDPITYVKIVAPSSNISLENYGVSGWSINSNSSFAELTGGSVASGSVFNFNYHGTSGATEVASADWTVTTNTGAGVVQCTGTLGTAISGIADRTAPEITDLTVSGITNSSVTITWTTNEAATSNVDYGLTEDYGTAGGDNTLVTSHSVVLTGLTINTSYSFAVYSSDSAGNTARNEQNSFTTASVSSSGTVTITNTVTTTTTVTNTVTKLLTDTTPPVIQIKNQISKVKENDLGVFESAPLIEGSASDDRGVAKIEYRITNYELGWSGASLLGTVGDKKTGFEFVPPLSLDGTYTVEVRAVDVFGNKSVPKKVMFVIDRLPPTVGGVVFSIREILLMPESGAVTTLEGEKLTGIFKELGGSESVVVKVDDKEFVATKDKSTSVWSVEIVLPVGVYSSQIEAVDGAGKIVKKNWVTFEVLPLGKVKQNEAEISEIEVSLWRKNIYGFFVKQETGNKLGWVVTPGEYFVSGKVRGQKYVSQVMKFSTSGVISGVWELGKGVWWNKLLPSGRVLANYQQTVKVKNLEINNGLVPAKWFGVNRLVYVTTPDLPYSTEGLLMARKEALDNGMNLSVVGLQASEQEMEIWMRGTKEDYLADWDGKWLQDGKLKFLPTKYYLDTFGKVVNIKEGVY